VPVDGGAADSCSIGDLRVGDRGWSVLQEKVARGIEDRRPAAEVPRIGLGQVLGRTTVAPGGHHRVSAVLTVVSGSLGMK
jgi:hypothetical protein